MKVFIVYAHPSEDSFTRHIRDAFIEGLKSAGHEYWGCTFVFVLTPTPTIIIVSATVPDHRPAPITTAFFFFWLI
jgi:hypothetical protein